MKSIKTYNGQSVLITDELERKLQLAESFQWEDVQHALAQIPVEKDKGLHGLVCYYAAFYMWDNGRQEECLNYLNEGIECMMGTPQERELSRCYNMLGAVAHSQNNLLLAMEHYRKALSYVRQYVQSYFYCLIQGNMADVYLRVKSYENAVCCYRECIKMLRTLGKHTLNESSIYFRVLANYGYCLTMADRMEEATQVEGELERLAQEEENFPKNRLAEYEFFAILNYRRGENMLADDYMNKAMQEAMKGNNISNEFENILNLIEYLIMVERFDYLEKLLDYLEPQSAIEQNEGFLLQLSLCRMQYCSENMSEEDFLESTHVFFSLKDKYENAENGQILRMMSLRSKLRTIEEEQKQLLKKNTKLIYQAEHDELSGLYNKRCMNRRMEEMFEQAMHKELPLGVLFVDIDFFKQMNDKYGHQKGDSCIIAISEAIKTCMPEDFAVRYGGDEFVIITIGRPREYLEECAQMLVDDIRVKNIPNEDSEQLGIVTITVGAVCAVPQKPNKMWDFLSAADEALYQQKRERKGRVRFYVGRGDRL